MAQGSKVYDESGALVGLSIADDDQHMVAVVPIHDRMTVEAAADAANEGTSNDA